MNKTESFWLSLEKYGWRVVRRSPLPRYWRHVVIGVVLVAMATSFKYMKYSVASAENTKQVVEKAARSGDYETAQRLYERIQTPDDRLQQLESLVYPERVVEQKIDELERKLEEYPSNRELYLDLAKLYDQLGKQESADQYREKARILDPNNVGF
jgi:tetratricopeptide (TPR) repeat protein